MQQITNFVLSFHLLINVTNTENQNIKTQHDSVYMRAHAPPRKAGGSLNERKMETEIANPGKSQPLSCHSWLWRIRIEMLLFFVLWHGDWYVNPVKSGRRHQGVLWWPCPRNRISITRWGRISGIFGDSLFCTSSVCSLASDIVLFFVTSPPHTCVIRCCICGSSTMVLRCCCTRIWGRSLTMTSSRCSLRVMALRCIVRRAVYIGL